MHPEKRKVGRFLKGNSPLMKSVSVQEFSFSEITRVDFAFFDNPESSIIHTRLHGDTELGEVVRPADKFNESFTRAADRRPVLQPIDFTDEWRLLNLRSRNPNRRADDDDLLELANLENLRGQAVNDPVKPVTMPQVEVKPVSDQLSELAKQAEGTSPLNVGQYATMDIVGNAIKDITGLQATAERHPLQTTAPAAMKTSDAFISIQQPLAQPGDSLEEKAMGEYKERMLKEKLAEEDVIRAVDEAKSLGYQEGFKIGEEKGHIQAKGQLTGIVGNVNSLIQEFSNLKSTVLDNIQQNFYEVTQAIAESLIGKELAVNPEAFAAVVRKAVKEAVPENQFKIRLHPTTFEKFSVMNVPEFTGALIKDDKIPENEFKIESNLSVVDGNVKRMIKELLDQADLGLFNKADSEKAS